MLLQTSNPVRIIPIVPALDQVVRDAMAARIAHLQCLHGSRFRGEVTVIVDSDFEQGTMLRARQLASHPDVLAASHVSLQRHSGSRSRLERINAIMWAEVEIKPGSPFHGRPPEEICGTLLARMDAASLPRPSYVTFSGRGLWAVWLSDRPLKPVVAHRVRKLVRALWGARITSGAGAGTDRVKVKAAMMAAIWQGMDLDRSIGDMARVHRVCGSINEKSGLRVRLLWPDSWTDVQRHDLRTLSDAVHPYTRHETREYLAACRERREAREAQVKAEGRTLTPARPHSYSTGLWGAVERELMTVLSIGHQRLANLGRRDLLCFHVAVARARSGAGGNAASWAADLAPYVAGPVRAGQEEISEATLATYLKPCSDRLRRHEAGEVRTSADGSTSLWLYTPRLFKIREDLDLPADLVEELGLTLLDPGATTKTATERSAARRVRQGAMPRSEQARILATVARLAHEMMADTDLPVAEIARILGCHRTSVYRALETYPETVTTPDQEETVSPPVADSARNLQMAPPATATQAPAPAPAIIETTAKVLEIVPGGVGKDRNANPATPFWPPYDPTERLYALAEHFRSMGRIYDRHDNPRHAFQEAKEMLAMELESGRRFAHVRVVPDRQRGKDRSSPWSPPPTWTCCMPSSQLH